MMPDINISSNLTKEEEEEGQRGRGVGGEKEEGQN